MADACLPLIPRCNSQSLANLAWACATARHYRPDLMAAIAGAAVRSMPSFTATSLANLVWAFASLQHWQPELFAAAAPRAAALMPAMDYLAVEMLLWAFATFGVRVRRCTWVLLCDGMAYAGCGAQAMRSRWSMRTSSVRLLHVMIAPGCAWTLPLLLPTVLLLSSACSLQCHGTMHLHMVHCTVAPAPAPVPPCQDVTLPPLAPAGRASAACPQGQDAAG